MALKHSADRRTLVVVASYFVVLAGALSLPLTWSLTPLFVAGLSLISFICAVITHNTIHAPIFTSREANRAMQVVLTLTYGHPVSAFVPGHNLSHHRHTQSDQDLMRTSKLRYRWNFLNQLLFAWTVGPTIFSANLRFAKRMRTRRPKWFRQLILEAVILVVMMGAILIYDPLKFLLFVMIPHQYAAWGIMGINFVQHDGCDPESKYNHSRNFVGPWVNWITFNNGYHGIHHMYPSMHWSLLPDAHARLLAPHIHPQLDQPNIALYLWRAFGWPGRRTTFDGQPYEPKPAGPDREWIPGERELSQEDLGAAA
ncbi:MAG: fatty acid desaturase [Myxococcota bacterium]